MRVRVFALWAILTIALLGFTAFIAVPPSSAASTGLTICNRSAKPLSDVAVGYFSRGVDDSADAHVLTGPFVSTGFDRIQPGNCLTRANPFGARYMFWFGAQVDGINTHGDIWNTTSNSHFCIPDIYSDASYAGLAARFTFEDENASEAACTSSSFYPTIGPNHWVSTRKVDTEVNATVDFDGH